LEQSTAKLDVNGTFNATVLKATISSSVTAKQQLQQHLELQAANNSILTNTKYNNGVAESVPYKHFLTSANAVLLRETKPNKEH
jgi:hypothetical protein